MNNRIKGVLVLLMGFGGATYAGDFSSLAVTASDIGKSAKMEGERIPSPAKPADRCIDGAGALSGASCLEELVFANKEGCVVRVYGQGAARELEVTDAKGQRITLGIGQDFKSGYFLPYCSSPRVELNFGDEFTMSCYSHYTHPEEDAIQTTRGLAGIKMRNGLSDVFVRGEVKHDGQWKIETDIRCADLVPAPAVKSGKNSGVPVSMAWSEKEYLMRVDSLVSSIAYQLKAKAGVSDVDFSMPKVFVRYYGMALVKYGESLDPKAPTAASYELGVHLARKYYDIYAAAAAQAPMDSGKFMQLSFVGRDAVQRALRADSYMEIRVNLDAIQISTK